MKKLPLFFMFMLFCITSYSQTSDTLKLKPHHLKTKEEIKIEDRAARKAYNKSIRGDRWRHFGFNVVAITVWISAIKIVTKVADDCKSCT